MTDKVKHALGYFKTELDRVLETMDDKEQQEYLDGVLDIVEPKYAAVSDKLESGPPPAA